MSLKLREMWNECERLDKNTWNVFIEGLQDIHHKNWGGGAKPGKKQSAKACVATRGKKLKPSRKDWTEAEESMLKKCCEGVSVAKGVKAFREKTGNVRTAGACKFRVYEMRLGGRW